MPRGNAKSWRSTSIPGSITPFQSAVVGPKLTVHTVRSSVHIGIAHCMFLVPLVFKQDMFAAL